MLNLPHAIKIPVFMMALLVTCAKPASAQNRVVTYLNKRMEVVAEKDSAMYIRLLSPGDSASAILCFF
ncbi:hypothetical protein [Olivibacter ginsenosidimutans]|uniref:hypothetical protein n=1 Tax=Olivibacter ginsenosidimutans TaxID=1176537 RepID=UPI0031E5B73A